MADRRNAERGTMKDLDDFHRELDRFLARAREDGIRLSDRCVGLQCALDYLKQYGDR